MGSFLAATRPEARKRSAENRASIFERDVSSMLRSSCVEEEFFCDQIRVHEMHFEDGTNCRKKSVAKIFLVTIMRVPCCQGEFAVDLDVATIQLVQVGLQS